MKETQPLVFQPLTSPFDFLTVENEIVSCLFPFVTTYFVFSPFFVGFYVFFFHNDSFSSFSLNFVSINSIFLVSCDLFFSSAPFAFLRIDCKHYKSVCRILSRISCLVFHIIPCIFSLFVLELFYRICIYLHVPRTYPLCKNMPAVFAVTQNIGCFSCCRYSERSFDARKI